MVSSIKCVVKADTMKIPKVNLVKAMFKGTSKLKLISIS